MFNDQVFNGTIVPSSVAISSNALASRLTYNGFTLHDGVTFFSTWKYLDGKKVDFTAENIDNDDGVMYNFRRGIQGVEVMGVVQKDSRDELLAVIDTMKAALNVPNKTLFIKDGTKERQVTAACVSTEFAQNHYNIEREDFKIIFNTFDFWQDATPVTDNVNGITDATYNYPRQRLGNETAKVYALLTFTAATGVTSITITIGDAILTIPTAITSGDSIVIDGKNLTVTKNGTAIGFSGVIPKLRNSSQNMTITTNGSARTYNLSTVYNPAY